MQIEFENAETERHRLMDLQDGEIAVLLGRVVAGSGTLPLGTVVQRNNNQLTLLGEDSHLNYPYWFTNETHSRAEIQILKIKVSRGRRPFNLEEAKAGARIVTEEGKEVKFVACNLNHVDSSRVVVSDGELFRTYCADGRYYPNTTRPQDLFLED